MITPISQMRKLRYRDVKVLTQHDPLLLVVLTTQGAELPSWCLNTKL